MAKHIVALWHNHDKIRKNPNQFKIMFGFPPVSHALSIKPRNFFKKQPKKKGED